MSFACAVPIYSAYSGASLVSSTTLFFLLAAPAVGVASLYRQSTKAWGALLMIVMSYEALAGPIDSLSDSGKVFSLFALDKSFWGFNLTGWIQSSLSSAALTAGTYLLYELLIPFVALTSVVVWRYSRPNFGMYITAMLLTSYAAMLTFLVAPTAPPWLAGAASNLVENSGVGTATSYLGPLAAVFQPDYYAAFPSMHAAYAIICSYFLLKANTKVGLTAVIFAAGTLFSTLYLGQHFLIDLVAGGVYAVIPCVISERWQVV